MKDTFSVFIVAMGIVAISIPAIAGDISYIDKIKVSCYSREDCLGMAKMLIPVAREASKKSEHERAAVYMAQISQYVSNAVGFAESEEDKSELLSLECSTIAAYSEAKKRAVGWK